jgi:hypothetical protein
MNRNDAEKETFFLEFKLRSGLDGRYIAGNNFIKEFAAKLGRKGYALFWTGSTENGFPLRILVGCPHFLGYYEKMQADFQELIVEMKLPGNPFESGNHYDRVEPK